jgi:hypothetical protein
MRGCAGIKPGGSKMQLDNIDEQTLNDLRRATIGNITRMQKTADI